MSLFRTDADSSKLPEGEAAAHRRLAAASVVALLLLCWGKIITEIWVDWNLWAVLLPMCAGVALLAYFSPPVAAAFFFLGNYFLGNLSIVFYPRMSFLTVIAAVLLGTLLIVRWRRGELGRFLSLPKHVWLALAGLTLFFLLGFSRAAWQAHMLMADPAHPSSAMAAIKEGLSGDMRGSNLLSHYMFLSHWLTFLLIGVLACVSRDEFKTFFLSFSILFVAQLLAIPLYYYPQFFREIYVECQSLGFGYAQANRGNLGYMAALASGFALTQAHDKGDARRFLLLAWWLILSGFVFLSASKGPIAAWLLATAFVVWGGRRLGRTPSRIFAGALLATVLLSTVAGYSVVPCGTVKKLGESRQSIAMRIAGIQDRLAPYLSLKSGETIHLPEGKTMHLSAEDAVRIRAGESEDIRLPNGEIVHVPIQEILRHRAGSRGAGPDLGDQAHAKNGIQPANLGTWLFGKGFGGSTRSVVPETGALRTHAGSLNIFFDLFIEVGLIGLALFVYVAALLWRNFRTTMAGVSSGDSRLLTMSMTAMIIVLLVKINVAAETPTEDLAALTIGLLIGAAGIRRPSTQHAPVI